MEQLDKDRIRQANKAQGELEKKIRQSKSLLKRKLEDKYEEEEGENPSYAAGVQEEYHVGQSILVDIPQFGAVRDLPLDYMHLVCLGVVKNNLNLWATELRLFLLYAGPVVLAKVKEFRPDISEHFINLSIAMDLVLNPITCKDYKDYVSSPLEIFVNNFKKLYGNHLISHNIHGLLHIADDVITFGALDNCSAFPFENVKLTLKVFHEKT
ncbi:uncharacterized protein LOC128984508 [Macrosteles quadrilineatus]|uniref:uncharacterized protein LOC128984508 n=1 Tax=Macrosteles quadrilineatus TaxID=74068 RepID=UPI0023E20F0C|nr:uncharacterized protein LOC128984508 [Macrosteles quadrilineatus]